MKKIMLPILMSAALFAPPAFAQDSTKAAMPMKTVDTSKTMTVYGPVKTFGGARQFAGLSLGVNAGAFSPQFFIGTNQFSHNQVTLGYAAYLKYQFSHDLGIRVDYVGGTLKANNGASSQNSAAAFPANVPNASTKLAYGISIKGEADIASINFLKRRNGIRLFVTGGYGLAQFTPSNYGKKIKSGYVPVGAGIKFRASEALAINLGYDAYFFDGSNLMGAPYATGDSRQSKASMGYLGLEYIFGAGAKKQALIWNNPVAGMYDELKNNDSLSKEITNVKTRVTAVEGDVSNLKKDSDGDGVSDVFDKCPNTPAGNKVDGSGCDLPKVAPPVAPVVEKITEEEVTVVREAFKNLDFATNKTTIKETSYPSLDKLADILNAHANLSLTLKGYTDNVGKAAANMKLSRGRADAVKDYLVQKGVADTRISAKGFGRAHPVASNKTKAGKAKNRRVEFNLF